MLTFCEDGFMSELAKQEKGTDGPVLGKEERMAVSVACARGGADAAVSCFFHFLLNCSIYQFLFQKRTLNAMQSLHFSRERRKN